MRAVAVFPGEREIRVVEIPEPRIAAETEVRLRVLEVGVCGTDKEICAFHYGTPPAGRDRLVIGHECLAEVLETGRGVTRVKRGDLVALTVRRGCGRPECTACAEGRQDFCYTGQFTERGIKERDGYMTEYVVEDESNMVVVPPALRDVAVLIEPLTIAEKALLQVWTVQQRLPWACAVQEGKEQGYCHRCVALGAGPVGLLGAMAFRAAGFQTIVYSREPEDSDRAGLVRSFGAVYVSSERTPVEGLTGRVGAIDVVYEATGASRLSFEVLSHVGANAIFIFTGVPGRRGPVEIDTDLLMRNMVLKNQVVLGTVNAGRDAFEAAVSDLRTFMTKWPEATRALITGRFTVDQHLEPLTSGAGIKNVIRFAAAG